MWIANGTPVVSHPTGRKYLLKIGINQHEPQNTGKYVGVTQTWEQWQ